MSTIAAISSPPGPGRRAVIRISGPRAAELVRATLRAADGSRPALGERALLRGRLDDGRGSQPALLLWMPGPHSYTREDVAELHLPGAPPLVQRALARLWELGAEPAQPGEFTRRAFENGRIDLLAAEGVLEMTSAASLAQSRAAAALLAGGLSERVAGLRAGLEELRALCEASLDFESAETGHVAEAELARRTAGVAAALGDALAWEERREPGGGLPLVVLAGAPNAGKSTLFNALAEADRALVSELPGSTRDGVGAALELGGLECRLLDAPGLDPAARGPDALAQELAGRERRAADLVLWVLDATASPTAPAAEAPEAGAAQLLVWNKIDLAGALARPPAELLRRPAGDPRAWVAVSAASGQGLDDLRRAAGAALGLEGPGAGEGAGLGRELSIRHRQALADARRAVGEAADLLGAAAPLDLVAEALRAATEALDGITGRTTAEDLLDRIFGAFCLGK